MASYSNHGNGADMVDPFKRTRTRFFRQLRFFFFFRVFFPLLFFPFVTDPVFRQRVYLRAIIGTYNLHLRSVHLSDKLVPLVLQNKHYGTIKRVKTLRLQKANVCFEPSSIFF